MKAVLDRIVQYANRYQLTNVETGEVLGTFDLDEVTGTVQQVGTEIDKELFDSIANDLAARVKLSGGELAETIVTFPDISGTAENVASGDTSATLWGKVKNWFSRLKALAFKNKVAAGDFEEGAIKNADVAADAAIAQSKVSGLMTDYVASISASGRTVTYKNKNGVNMGSITTQDTTYGLASQSGNGLMSANDKTKLDGIQSGAQKNTVLGVKGGSESAYRTGNVNITKENIGLGNVDNTADTDKPVSAATQLALNGKANTNGTYPNMTVGKATNADNATNATNATNAVNAKKAEQDAGGNVIDETYAKLSQVVRVDEEQNLTEAQKKTFAANMGKPYGAKFSGGWMKMAVLKRTAGGAGALYAVFLISSSNNPMAYGLLKVSTYATASSLYDQSIELISLSSQGLSPSVIRGVYDNSDSSITIYVKGSSAYNAITLQTISNYGTEPFDITIDPENVTTEPTENITCTWGRIEASSFVQDGHDVALQDGTYSDMTVGNVTTNINGKAITSIFESDGTTVKNATIAQYASSDTSKGTIEERLTSLGFKVGNINLSSDVSASLGTGGVAPAIIKLGNMCYIFGRYTHDGVGSSFVIGTIPEEFRPKDNTFAMWYVSGYAGENVYCRVSINSSSGEITASNDSGGYALDHVDFLGSYDANTKTVQFAQIAYGV